MMMYLKIASILEPAQAHAAARFAIMLAGTGHGWAFSASDARHLGVGIVWSMSALMHQEPSVANNLYDA